MLITVMRTKLHRATVTQCDLHYEGSVSIDRDLLEIAGLLTHEQVHIWNVNNGARITTYAIEAPAGSSAIGINGAAARYFELADRVIISAFAQMPIDDARTFKPNVVLLDEYNQVIRSQSENYI